MWRWQARSGPRTPAASGSTKVERALDLVVGDDVLAEDRKRRDVEDDAAPPPAGFLAGRPRRRSRRGEEHACLVCVPPSLRPCTPTPRRPPRTGWGPGCAARAR